MVRLIMLIVLRPIRHLVARKKMVLKTIFQVGAARAKLQIYFCSIRAIIKTWRSCLGIVLPGRHAFGEGVKTRIKQHLLEECNLHTIIRLPGTVFTPYTSITTNLLFFTKGGPTKKFGITNIVYPKASKPITKLSLFALKNSNL